MSRPVPLLAALLATLAAAAAARGPDTWVQTATRVARPDDVVHVDLALGNQPACDAHCKVWNCNHPQVQ